jgi:hypothetical protein
MGENVSDGGAGAVVSSDLPANAGDVLFVEVGGNGQGDSQQPAFNGGGSQASDCRCVFGGGGGGASDVRLVSSALPDSLTSRVVVAAGGGGAGLNSAGGNAGAGGGGLLAGGTAATLAGPGMGGQCGPVTAGSGTFGVGGDAEIGGGSGGGGYFGGGGGTGDVSATSCNGVFGGGGGGSSYVTTAATNTTFALDSTATPEVIITAPVPVASSGPAIAGGLTVGDLLTQVHGVWTSPEGFSTTGYDDQWQRCDASGAEASCAAIPGATGLTYTLTGSDLGSTIRLLESATDFYGTSSRTASAVSAVVQAPAPTASTGGAAAITPTSATLTGIVNPNGGEVTATFAYATSPTLAAATSTPPQIVPTGLGAVPVSTTPTGLRPHTRYYFRVTATNTGTGASANGAILQFITSQQINSTVTGAFAWHPNYTVVQSLAAHEVPVGARVSVKCSGHGCRPRPSTLLARRPKCQGRRCSKTPTTLTIDLTPLFRGRRLAPGTRVTITITQPNSVGKIYTYTIQAGQAPRALTNCLAPNSHEPGQGC